MAPRELEAAELAPGRDGSYVRFLPPVGNWSRAQRSSRDWKSYLHIMKGLQ